MMKIPDLKLLPKKYLILIIFSLIILIAIGIYFFIFYKLPTPYSLKDYKAVALSTHITDRNGKLLYEIYRDQNRTAVKLKDLPPYLFQATIAIEDKDFYRHQGVSLVSGVLRAIKDMVISRNLQGGSTLTQQLVKSALLSSERTIQRKIKEIVLALWTEKIFSKDQILEMYLNQVPYGGSAYGVQEGSKVYFGKDAKNLTLAEAATLAGLPQAPSLYSPYLSPDLTIRRRNDVLQKMFEQKYITLEQRDKAQKEDLTVIPLKTNINAPHFVFYVKAYLEETYGTKTVEEGGLQVTTTLDLDTQEQAEKIIREELEKVKYLDVSNGALLVTRPPTGEILAMIGSVDYFASPSGSYNVATTALRQPGSSIKPLNYAVGIDRKLVTPGSLFLDTQTCFSAPGQPNAYCPVNYDGKFHGIVPLRMALGNSYNIPAVKMLAMNGVENFVASASAFGINSFKKSTDYGLSLTLGGGEVHMTEMAQAFSTFANQGISKKLNPILIIKDRLGHTLYENKDGNIVTDIKSPMKYPNFFIISGKRAVSTETSFLISHILLDNNARTDAFGSSSYLVVPNRAVSVKTGTTDDKKDNWTIGYTPNFLTVVWVGNNDGTPMNQALASGVTGAAPIWNRVMTYVLKSQPDLWPIKPDSVVGHQICNDTGLLMSKGADGKDSCPARYEYFIKGTENKDALAPHRETVPVGPDDKLVSPNFPGAQMKEKTVVRDAYSLYCLDCAH